MSYHIVWFKRDLRLHDHAALQAAGRRGPVLCLYVVEPALWRQPDAARQHYEFVRESLRDLARALRALGGQLLVTHGDMPQVLERLWAVAPFAGLYAHEETGNAASYTRDRAVASWCRARGVPWQQHAQFGVVRGLQVRAQQQLEWEALMDAPCAPEPLPGELRFCPLPWPAAMPAADELGLAAHDPPQRQRGGRTAGLQVLHSFLQDRARHYRGGISSPLSAPTACSRLSPYLAWGNLSLREVVQATRGALAERDDARLRQGLHAFTSRLHWHCHFIQKLESEPAIEFENMHRGYDGLREDAWNPVHFDALVAGRTGWPMVDACVAMLRATGWINFRMRAMLVSVAAYPLWLHWRPVGLWLATQFLDYEPGIHWSQLQMQSGTTGINTTRVYNPIKQAQDYDPAGRFVRQWLPAMRRVPDSWLFEPWRMPPELQIACGLQPGVDIPQPLVELEAATRLGKERLHALRREPQVRAGKAAVVERHGSHKRTAGNRRAAAPPASDQLRLDF